MINIQPLTRDDLKAVFKEIGVATKDDLKAMEDRQDKKYVAKDDLSHLEQTTKEHFKRVATRDDLLHVERRLKLRMGKHRNEIFAMFGKLATSTPSRREFTELKLRA